MGTVKEHKRDQVESAQRQPEVDKLPDVLLIDESDFIHKLLRKRLYGESFNLHSASGGERGVKMALELRPALVLLDLTLTGVGGFQTLRKLKDAPSLQDTQVIVTSPHNDTEDMVASFELGACDFVTKPFNMPELRARMKSALRVHELLTLLAERAQVDGLTGIGNRACFDKRLKEEVSHRDRTDSGLTVAMCDIDHFKKINDTFGHTAGDEVIRGVARRLQRSLRERDIACRYGGEEFGLILRETEIEHAIAVIDRLRVEISEIRWPAHPEHRVTCSFGLCNAPTGNARDASGWVRAADEALYAAKRGGRNQLYTSSPAGPRRPLKLAS